MHWIANDAKWCCKKGKETEATSKRDQAEGAYQQQQHKGELVGRAKIDSVPDHHLRPIPFDHHNVWLSYLTSML